MNQITLKALEGSIEKWRKIVEEDGIDMGVCNCTLCAEFIGLGRWGCNGCPVKLKTGKRRCMGTPYDKWCEAEFPGKCLSDIPEELRPKALAIAKAELAFLKSLLPKPKKAK